MVLRVRTSVPEPPQLGPPSAWLTLKAAPPREGASPLVRLEFEYPIPLADGLQLLDLTPRQVCKRRHGLDLSDGDWVLDVFEGANAPLVVAEVELEAPEQPVAVPSWCVRELTGRQDLSNAALARRPLQEWTPEERQELWGSHPPL
jgi:CYTH domain-containing protein